MAVCLMRRCSRLIRPARDSERRSDKALAPHPTNVFSDRLAACFFIILRINNSAAHSTTDDPPAYRKPRKRLNRQSLPPSHQNSDTSHLFRRAGKATRSRAGIISNEVIINAPTNFIATQSSMPSPASTTISLAVISHHNKRQIRAYRH